MSTVVCHAQDDKIIDSFCRKGDMGGGLSFLQSMSDITAINVRNREDTSAYVPSIEKQRSVSKLNEKSLEMCTESLGTETGSESSGDELSLLAFEATTTPPPQLKPQEHEDTNLSAKKSTLMSCNNTTFPPPIKFVEDSKYNRIVRMLGEDGRLVVQAVRVSSPSRCFVAERREGRLRLICLSSESSLLRVNDEEEEDETEETEEENSENLEGKNGNKKFSRLSSRCKESGREPKPMLTWEQQQQQFWVTT